jgi:2-methylcitrate dehydratase PrpD
LKDPTFAIAQNLVEVEYKDLPGQIVDIAKKEVLDSLGVALAGSAAPGIQELAEVLKGFGGNKQASMIAGRLKLPVLFAAQVNASMMHALDYDDAMDNTVAHTGCITVPVCFALSECRGKISGKDCITALTLGADLMARLGLATKYKGGMVKAGWFYASLYGYMTAAAVSGKILGFNENKMINALGLAYQMTSGNQQAVIDGALAKRMAVGFAASGGIMAALMAEKGITGAKNIIEGDYGLFNVYHRGAYDREALLSDLGQDFKLKDLTIKPYPS